ncbi:MAG: flagellar brake protein [Treponema sp.]|jgi:c-di-GMP-binding flagellar brake protein YcgR|nr:flagellar brake protein [Treponema sp.]
MFLTILVIVIVAAGIIILVVAGKGKGKSASWLQFYAKGKDSGFSLKEIDLLHRLAVQSNLEDPSSLFWSQNQLDHCIRALVKDMRMGGDNDQENQDFLSKLYDFRKKIEMNKPKNKNGITNSRQISDGQNLRILVAGTGVFKSQIVKTTGQYITISRPASDKQHEMYWPGTNISVYFWRENDAGYVFDTDVIDEVFSKGLASLKINHSDKLFRTQKRKSIRVKFHKSAFLYLLNNDEDTHRPELNPGVKCFLEDISDSGCAITIGGKASEGLRIKVQFILKNNPIVMPGTVRSISFKPEINRSLLHIEADPLPIEVRNQILGEVFGMLPEEEEDLPFRIMEEEADSLENVEVLEEDTHPVLNSADEVMEVEEI